MAHCLLDAMGMRRLVVFAVVLSSGCDLYFNGGGDDEPCAYPAADIAPAEQFRNPQTGACEGWGYPCDSRCGPCPETAGAIAPPDWGSCYSACEGLDETTCMGTSGCFATYLVPDPDDGPTTYNGCWQTAPSGPVGGSCAGLDAHECSRHDNCIANYKQVDNRTTYYGPLEFQSCAAEPAGSCTGVTCPPDSHCEEQCDASGNCKPVCVADGSSCAVIDCAPGYECVDVCTDPGNGTPPYCDGQCVASTACEALADETSCKSRSDCTPVYLGDDCTCYPTGCTCEVLTYDRCETK